MGTQLYSVGHKIIPMLE